MTTLKNLLWAGILCPLSAVSVLAEKSPQLYTCGGTEPFWSADVTKDTLSFSVIGEEPQMEPIEWAGPAQGRPEDFIKGITAGPYTAVMRKQICSDGMSDQEYPWAIVMMNRTGDDVQMVEGCCR
ncbi:hypothetical protein F9L33_01925 [Amylibacter sp. SFDW26]|uniref:hypothetical protein n=1 Tax=Amylibacter sp. SFDW26 TaxID=2652722 RepID=UPI0012628F54|nr:hypothetical protein [Amylibacter sp. SFDW26]KAB7615546.1 hypothetical protein F9L33_01925 [Amylibacter sp. SFDW26]